MVFILVAAILAKADPVNADLVNADLVNADLAVSELVVSTRVDRRPVKNDRFAHGYQSEAICHLDNVV